MSSEVIDCDEFSEVAIRLSSLMKDGELEIDPRIAAKGYLTTAFKGGQVLLRSTKYVGLIPLTPSVSIRVKPRANISNLSLMLVRSQKAPTAISGFGRGYTEGFFRAENVERLFGPSLVAQSLQIMARGLVKRYERPEYRTPWRGRFLAAETVRRHASKGIRYRHEFDQSVLTENTIDNFAIKEALKLVASWYQKNDTKASLMREVTIALAGLQNVQDWKSSSRDLLGELAHSLSGTGSVRPDYLDPLWSSYAVLAGAIPDVAASGTLNLDSLIVDVSEVFEAYLRRELSERLKRQGFKIFDGWKKPSRFFADGGNFSVHPDIIIERQNAVVAVIDAKYKPDVSEQDRYEVLSFMDVMNVNVGGFVCPARDNEISRFMGTTSSGKRLSNLRFDLAAPDPSQEIDRFVENVLRLIQGRQDFL